MNFYSHYKVFVYNHDFEKIDDVLSILIFEKFDNNIHIRIRVIT